MSTVQNNTTYKNNMKLYDEAYESMKPKYMNKEFKRWHYRSEHITFWKMKLLSALGVLPKQLQECTPPACAVCLYG